MMESLWRRMSIRGASPIITTTINSLIIVRSRRRSRVRGKVRLKR